MIVLCPTCKARYNVDETKIGDEGMRLKCPKCQTVFRVKKPAAPPAKTPTPPAPAPPPLAKPPAPPPTPPAPPAPAAAPQPRQPAAKPLAIGPYKPSVPSVGTVVVADSDQQYLKHVARLLLQAGYTVYLAEEGNTAIKLIKSKLPHVAIVDVGLPEVFGFQIAEQVKQDPALAPKVGVILLGSVYEKDRFRRQPQSLYGADAYIEKHHDGPAVLSTLKKLMAEPRMPAPAPQPPAPPAQAPRPPAPAPKPPAPPAQAPRPPAPAPKPPAPPAQAPRPTAPAPQPPAPPAPAPRPPAVSSRPATGMPDVPNDPEHQKAARLARTIVSDISLYNSDLVTQGVKDGNVYDLLAKDMEDGLRHYNLKVSQEVRNQRDYFREAMEAMIGRKKKELGLA